MPILLMPSSYHHFRVTRINAFVAKAETFPPVDLPVEFLDLQGMS